MQASPPPAKWWWEALQWRRQRAQERKGVDHETLAQHLDRLQRLRDMQALLDRQKLPMPDILIYSPSKFNNLHQVQTAIRPTSSWSQRPLSWDTMDYHNAIKNLDSLNESVRSKGVAKFDDQGMWGAARGWAAGAFLLLAALIIVRATDRCLTRGFFRSRRRRSDEWTTPSVQATRHHQDDIVSALNTVDPNRPESSLNSASVDPPPPYSACSTKHEEPPPPYSACYIAYPKNGQSVCLYDGQQQIIRDNSNQQNERQEVAHLPAAQVTVNIENPSTTTVRLAPMASRELSMDSDDASLYARNSTSC